jgi:hypothetical protein
LAETDDPLSHSASSTYPHHPIKGKPLTSEAALAFEMIISIYQEQSANSGAVPCMQYGGQSGGGSASPRPSVIRPSISDFLADVEINARRCLSLCEHDHFSRYYKFNPGKLDGQVIVVRQDSTNLEKCIASLPKDRQPLSRFIDKRVRQKLGDRFIEEIIFPFQAYMSPEDTYGRKQRTSRKKTEVDKDACQLYSDPQREWDLFWVDRKSLALRVAA